MKASSVRKALQDRLDNLAPRERRFVLGGVAVVVALLIWFIGLAPALDTVLHGPQATAEALDKASRVLLAAKQLETLRHTQAQVHIAPTELRGSLQSLIQTHGLNESARLSENQDGGLVLTVEQAPAAGVLALLAQAENIAGLEVSQLELRKQDAGRLSGQGSLKIQGPSPDKAAR